MDSITHFGLWPIVLSEDRIVSLNLTHEKDTAREECCERHARIAGMDMESGRWKIAGSMRYFTL